ncbi:MAG: hypothetical protein WC465_00955 [Patescibacteria group bacterium]
MHSKNQQYQYQKQLAKALKMSNNNLWRKLSLEQRRSVIDKYHDLMEIKSRGIQNVFSDIKQNRINAGSLFLGLILGIFGGIAASIITKYILGISWPLDLLIFFFCLVVCFAAYNFIDWSTYEDFRDYEILKYLLELVEKDKPKK